MEKEVLEKYKKAHDISDEAIEFARPLVKEGFSALEIAEKVEKKIIELGGKPAWPVNISINEVAAHYTPEIGDTLVFKENDLAKIDIGVQVDGYISDRAFTFYVGHKTHPLIECSEKATKAALEFLKPGVKVFEVSQLIENIVVKEFGFNPIRNLCGHSMDQYSQHEHPSIPNGKNNIQDEIGEQPIAVEVFATPGSGWVKESRPTNIFQFRADKPVRMWEARKILEMAKKDFVGLPFALRWIKNIPQSKVEMAVRQLLEIEAISAYPPLKEESNGLVAVYEDTVIVK